jgi:hypothetical protein
VYSPLKLRARLQPMFTIVGISIIVFASFLQAITHLWANGNFMLFGLWTCTSVTGVFSGAVTSYYIPVVSYMVAPVATLLMLIATLRKMRKSLKERCTNLRASKSDEQRRPNRHNTVEYVGRSLCAVHHLRYFRLYVVCTSFNTVCKRCCIHFRMHCQRGFSCQ